VLVAVDVVVTEVVDVEDVVVTLVTVLIAIDA
jgi:hypothetical protein